MDLEVVILSENRERQIVYITYMWSLKKNTNESIYKTNKVTDIENKLKVTKREKEGEEW